MKNVVVIVIDSLRSERLGCYGHHYDVSPEIDKLAADGVVFENCFSHSNCTLPALTTLYTGLTPYEHGVVHHTLEDKYGEHAQFRAAGYDTIQSVLKGRGYTTVGFDWLGGHLSDGFDKYYGILSYYLPTDECEKVTGEMVRWLTSELKTPFYWFVHFWDTHVPYQHHDFDAKRFSYPKTGIPKDTFLYSKPGFAITDERREWFKSTSDAADVMAWYDASVFKADRAVGEIVKVLRSFQLLDNTMIIVTGDHGESLIEHDIYFTHFGLYRQTLHVPMVIWGSDLKKGRVEALASSTGVFEVVVNGDFPIEPEILSWDGVGPGEMSALDTNYHYIATPNGDSFNDELYDMRIDSLEEVDVSDAQWLVVENFRESLRGVGVVI